MNRTVRTAALTVLAASAAGALVALIVRDQISRHRRDLFSPRAYRRLAALSHIGREPATVDSIQLLRDFMTWEPRRMLRDRARTIVDRMMSEVVQSGIGPGRRPA